MKTSKSLALGLFAFVLSACGRGDGDYDASGIFEATEVIVSAQSTGELIQFDVTEGQQLTQGIPVGYIDTMQLSLKKQQLMASRSAVDSRHASVPRQIASLKQQIVTQKNEQKRFQNLIKQHAANQKQLDDINAQLAVLEKQLAAQTENLENSNRAVSGESSALEVQIAQIEDQLHKSVVSSPINGTVLSKYAEMGEFVAPGKALFKVADMQQMFLRVYITSDQLTQMKIGQQVSVFADFGKKEMKEFKGKVTWISDKAEFTPKTIQTRNERANLVYAVKIAVKNDGYLKNGMYGEMKISQNNPK